MTDAPTRILLVDDHAIVRGGLRRLLDAESRFEVCAEAGTGREAVELADLKRPDVIVLDVGLPDADGLDLIEELRRKARGCFVLVLSMHDDAERVERSFSSGADGYLVKDAAEDELLTALDALVAGERYLYPPLGAALVRAASAPPKDPLTDREREVVRLLALGHTNAEAAKTMYLSIRTIESHRAHAMAKLRLDTRADLVAWALERGLLDDARS